MPLIIKSILIILWAIAPAKHPIKVNAAPRKSAWREYACRPDTNNDNTGTVLLYHDNKLGIANDLNLCILHQSEYMLDDEVKSQITSAAKIAKYFYPHNENTQQQTDISGNLSTKIMLDRQGILCYQVRLDYKNDKGSPYIEYLNIDRRLNQPIRLAQIIDSSKITDFKETVRRYASSHKKQLVQHYQQVLSGRADQLLAAKQEVFESRNYTLNRLSMSPKNPFPLDAITAKGLMIDVNLSDKNFTDYNHGYRSTLLIPQAVVRSYVNAKSDIGKRLLRLSPPGPLKGDQIYRAPMVASRATTLPQLPIDYY